MNWDRLHQSLIRAARLHPPTDAVPYAFEKRVMAGLRRAAPDPWSVVTRTLWWAAGACTAIAVSMSVWTSFNDPAGDDFAQDLEQTILASADETGLGVELDSFR